VITTTLWILSYCLCCRQQYKPL